MSVPGVNSDNVPYNYDHYLAPYLFEPYALDMVERLRGMQLQNVLELACGTGMLTRHMVKHLAPGDKLIATDIDPAMLEYAKTNISAANLEWQVADAQNLSFNDMQFELVLCQFGVMFFKNKVKAYKEIYRVLKPGGMLLFNVWDALEFNPRSALIKKILEALLKEETPDFTAKGPYAYNNTDVIKAELMEAGFKVVGIDTVPKQSAFNSIDELIKGFVDGSPLSFYLRNKLPALRQEIVNRLRAELNVQFDHLGFEIPMQALVITAIK